MDFLKKIHQEAIEAQKRWDKIDKQAKVLKKQVDSWADDDLMKNMGNLILMLVDHMRPLNNYKTDEMEKTLKEALSLLDKG